MGRLGPAVKRDPVLACFLLFALCTTAFDVLGLIGAALGIDTVTRLQERVVPYTGWVPSMFYAFSLYFASSALLTGNTRARSSVLIFQIMQVVFGALRWLVEGGSRASDNPYLQISEWRPLWTIVLPLLWLALLTVFKPRLVEAATVTTTHANG